VRSRVQLPPRRGRAQFASLCSAVSSSSQGSANLQSC
jgi:hypothetical protein